MKQKNVLLMVVAVVCGLGAAVLAAQMTGKPAAPDQVEIVSAAKELTIGTKIEKDKVAELLKKKKVNKTEVPENAVFTEEELVGKVILRPLRVNDHIGKTDIGDKAPGLSPPAGKVLATIRLPYESVGPFVEPGTHVDVLCAVQPPNSQRVRQFPLFTDMLVMAVDTEYANGPSGVQKQGGRPTVNTVTLAMSAEDTKWEQIARRLAADLRLVVRGEDSPKMKQPTEEELARLFFDADKSNDIVRKSEDPTKKLAKGKFPVAKTRIPAGTPITEELIEKKFSLKEFEGDATPDEKATVKELNDHIGKFLTDDLEKGDVLPLAGVTNKGPEQKDPPKVGPNEGSGSNPKEGVVEPKPVAPKPVVKKPVKVWEPEIAGPKGIEKHRYEFFDDKEGWQYKGVVGADGTVTPAPGKGGKDAAPKKEDDETPGGKIS